MRRAARRAAAIACMISAPLAAAIVYACVPADTRPLPGSVTLTASPSPAVAGGAVTDDGWRITFDRVIAGIGRASLGDTCVAYSEANYDRVLDVGADAGQKISILHGLGACDLRFSIGAPSSDALLGARVTDDDKARMRAPGADRYTTAGGIAFEVIGSAARDGVALRFDFAFRARVRYSRCALVPDAAPDRESVGVDLESQVDRTFDLRIEAEALFRDNVGRDGAALRFDPFAAADTDRDGVVTMDELDAVPIAALGDAGAFEAGTYDFDDDAGTTTDGRPVAVETLGDYVYVVLMPTVLRFRDTGSCSSAIGFGRGRRP